VFSEIGTKKARRAHYVTIDISPIFVAIQNINSITNRLSAGVWCSTGETHTFDTSSLLYILLDHHFQAFATSFVKITTISMSISCFIVILALSAMNTADSFLVRWPDAVTSSLQLSSKHQQQQEQMNCLHPDAVGEVKQRTSRWCALATASKQSQTGQQPRRQVLALFGLVLGWQNNFGMMMPNTASWTTASAVLDDAEPSSVSSSSSTPPSSAFPLVDSTDNVFKSKTIDITWDVNDQGRFNIDSVNTNGTSTGSQVRLSYQLPERWKTNSNDQDKNYIDVEKQAKACHRLTVYQAPAPVGEYTTMEALQKISGKVGVGKALHMPKWLSPSLYSADLLSARKDTKPNGQNDEQTYLELEMASAPSTCNTASSNVNDKLNLGLFCPYDTIYLLSATILNGQLYVLLVEASSEQWKRSNGDLKFVRSSFAVESL
jgi:hypothetical protein